MQLSINQRIKIVRESNNETQATFAKRIGISRSSLAQIETGIHLPTLKAVENIVREFNISYTWLMEGKGNQIEIPSLSSSFMPAEVAKTESNGNDNATECMDELNRAKEEIIRLQKELLALYKKKGK